MISPITEDVFGRVPDSTPADIDHAVVAARRALDPDIEPWSLSHMRDRPNDAPPGNEFETNHVIAWGGVARIEGRAPKEFSHESKGMMATTGHMKGVALLFGLRLHGLPAWLLWRAYYLLLMPTLGRKVRIWLEWTCGRFFAADITHLRFTRTSEADAEVPPPFADTQPSFQPQQ